MSSDDVAIRVRDVSKHYLMFSRPEDRLKQSIVPRLQRLVGQQPTQYYRDFAALNGVSFDVKRGETVGIIGRNGSGKSTLLQIVCGTQQATSGSVQVRGRIAALLELGAGFNPEFTGRENVYLNAAILGLGRSEIDRRFDDIARFADIGLFIEQPVKTYSSGMYIRLAFATAINVDPDILVVDEALAVGDEAFQRKCFARIESIRDKGATILFVSHGAQTIVQLCDRAILLDGGEKLLDGEPKPVVNQYQRLLNLTREEAVSVRAEIRKMRLTETQDTELVEPDGAQQIAAPAELASQQTGWLDPRLGAETVSYEGGSARIRDVRFLAEDGAPVNVLAHGTRYFYEYHVDFLANARDVTFGMLFKTVSGLELAGANDDLRQNRRLAMVKAGDTVRVKFGFRCRLLAGNYFTNAGVFATIGDDRKFLHRLLDALAFRVVSHDTSLDVGYFSLDYSLEATRINKATDAGAEAAS
jgi:lipopolysaccharide transport system ATP-binding protein